MVLVPYGTGRVGRRRFLHHHSSRLRAARGRSGAARGATHARVRPVIAPARAGGVTLASSWRPQCATTSVPRRRPTPAGWRARRVRTRGVGGGRRRTTPGRPKAARSRGKLGAAPAGLPVLPGAGAGGALPGQRCGCGSLPGAPAVQTWARAGGEPARRGREGRRSARRCGCSTTWAGGAGREGGAGRAASPRVANSSAVSRAPRMNSRSERRVGRSVVVEGNMCSESYGGRRTERVFPVACQGSRTGRIPRGCAERTARGLQRILHPGARALGRAAQPPSEDQISIFVRTLSTTASVNSVVVACPPRSIVFTPPATVSSTPS